MDRIESLLDLNDVVSDGLTRAAGPLIPTLARLAFVASLLFYYWNSAFTKLGEGVFGLFNLSFGTYGQMFPKAFEAAGYDPSQMSTLHYIVALTGTWAEFVLPFLILVGLLTRGAALGMIGFMLVQSYVDVTGHGSALGSLFDRQANGLVDQRMFWIFALAVLVLRGAGPISVDAVIRKMLGRDTRDAAGVVAA